MQAPYDFEEVVSQHYQSLYRFAISLARSETDAWDLTQETFYVWARKGHQLRDLSKVHTWLFTTLHRTFMARRRRQTRFPQYGLDEVADELPAFEPNLADRVDVNQAWAAMAQVEENYQAAVALFYLDQCSYQDIAVILEVPIGTVKSRISRGIAQLREILFSGGAKPTASRDEARRAPEKVAVRSRAKAYPPPTASLSWGKSEGARLEPCLGSHLP